MRSVLRQRSRAHLRIIVLPQPAPATSPHSWESSREPCSAVCVSPRCPYRGPDASPAGSHRAASQGIVPFRVPSFSTYRAYAGGHCVSVLSRPSRSRFLNGMGEGPADHRRHWWSGSRHPLRRLFLRRGTSYPSPTSPGSRRAKLRIAKTARALTASDDPTGGKRSGIVQGSERLAAVHMDFTVSIPTR